MLTAYTETPVVPETPVAPHPLKPLKIISELLVKDVSEGLAELAVLNVLLSVEEPVGDLELPGVLDDLDDLFDLFVGELSSSE